MGNFDSQIKDQTDVGTTDEPVIRLLSQLERVEPPKDFDIRVKARIAAGRSVDRHVSWLPASLRYAVPLVLLLLAGGYFAISTFYSSRDIDVPPVAESRPPIAVSPDEKAPVTGADATPSAETPPPEFADVKQPDRGQRETSSGIVGTTVRRNSNSNRTDGRSFEISDTVSHPIRPRGLEGNTTVVTNTNGIVKSTPISPKDLFEILGIKAAYDMSGWKVESVAANTTAERSGIKAGDMIEAVNDQRLTANTAFGSKFNGKSLRVRRDGRSLKIDLAH